MHLRSIERNKLSVVGLGLVLLLYFVLALVFTQTLHFSRALDEGYHLEYITFIKQQGRLPTSYEERGLITRADFPPLYHLLVALVSTSVAVDDTPNFKVFWDSFRYRAIDHGATEVWTLATEDFQRPYVGRFLVWQIGRWLSVVLSVLTVIVVYFTLRETPLGRFHLAPLAGAALLAFMPRYIILGSAINDDSLLALMAALYFWMLVKVINRPARWWPYVALGLFWGLSLTVKYSLVLIPLEVVVVLIVIVRKTELGWSWLWSRLGLVGIVALLSSSWWFGWNIWHLNTVAEDGWVVGLLRPLLAGGSDTTLNRLSGFISGGQLGLSGLPENTIVGSWPAWARSTFLTFWGVTIAGAQPLFPYSYIGIALLLAVAGLGIFILWRRNEGRLHPAVPTSGRSSGSHNSVFSDREWLAFFVLHIGIFIVLPLIRFGLTRRLGVAAQGRHILIPAATTIVALLIWGLVAALPLRWRRPALIIIVVGFLAWSGAHLHRLSVTKAQPLPIRTIPQAAEWLPHPATVQFGDQVELASYDIRPVPERGELQVDLAFRSAGAMNENYLLKLELLDSVGEPVSHWLGYTGNGRVPTLAWAPDFAVFDRLKLPLPDLPAGTYSLRLQVLGRMGPLTVSGPEGQGSDDHGQKTAFVLTTVTLEQPASLLHERQVLAGAGSDRPNLNFTLWAADGQKLDQLPEYRYPGTISIVAHRQNDLDDLSTHLTLVDAKGQAWSPSQAGSGIYNFVIDPQWSSGRYRLQVERLRGSEVVQSATSEPILTVQNWWKREFDAPDIAVPEQANFANQLTYLGYSLPQNQVKAGEALPVTLFWQALPHRSPQADFTQFNHLHDAEGTLYGGYDRRPLEYYSTLLWAPDEVIIDGYTVPVSADAPPGEYYLDVGYYLTVGESAVNLPLVVDGEMTELSSVVIGPIEVVAP